MNIESLALFVEVMHKRSFTEIAKAHGIAPSSVSRTITTLESDIGIRLFQRTTRKVMPTEAGMLYFERISLILDELAAAQQIAADLSNTPKGKLRVTAPTVFGEMHIVPLLPELANQYPDLHIELDLNDAYIDLVEERVDIAIRIGTLQNSSYIARKLADMTFYITASQTYIDEFGKPETPNQLEEHNCLLFPRAGHNLNWTFKNTNQSTTEVPIQGKHLITNSNAIRQCTLAGMGISLLPDWLIKQDVASGQLIKLFNEYKVTATDYEASVWLVYPSREYLPLKVHAFNDFLFERFTQKTDR